MAMALFGRSVRVHGAPVPSTSDRALRHRCGFPWGRVQPFRQPTGCTGMRRTTEQAGGQVAEDADGHDDVVERVFDAAYRRLVAQLYGVCGELAEAEEVVQEAFVRAVEQGSRFESMDNPEGWLRTVAVNVARSRHRRRRLGEALLLRKAHSEHEVLRHAELAESSVDLVAALRRLPSTQREAIALHYLADLPLHEVASTVRSPIGTVKARLRRGRVALAALLEEPASSGEEPTHPMEARHESSR